MNDFDSGHIPAELSQKISHKEFQVDNSATGSYFQENSYEINLDPVEMDTCIEDAYNNSITHFTFVKKIVNRWRGEAKEIPAPSRLYLINAVSHDTYNSGKFYIFGNGISKRADE